MTRVCTAACGWSAWSACGGNGYVGPTEETCGNGLDENCDGIADELCASIVVSGQIAKLVASPDGSVVYALDVATPSRVVVLDAATHAETAVIPLPQPAHDMDLSPNGQHLVVAHDVVHQISKIDLATNTVLMTKPVASDPYRIEVNDAGVVYYTEYDQWVDIRRVAASLDFATDTLLGSWVAYAADLELSPDGAFLYAGESGISGGALMAFDVSGGGLVKVQESTWDDGYGFPYPGRHLYLGPDGKRAYYAAHQLDAARLAFTAGRTGGSILAEDRAGTLAVGPPTPSSGTTTPPPGGCSGRVASVSWGAYEGALSATANGSSLFVGESSLSGSNMIKYDVSAGAFTKVGETTYNGGYGFPYPPRNVTALPNGSRVYYAGFHIDGTNLAILWYQQADTIRSVTPDGRLALSTTKVYRVSDGALLGALPTAGSVQAVSPDGLTLYVATPGAIATVDLGVY